MRDPNRIEGFMRRLQTIWNKMPDLRFGQLIGNCYDYWRGTNPYYIEDEEYISQIEELYQDLGGEG